VAEWLIYTNLKKQQHKGNGSLGINMKIKPDNIGGKIHQGLISMNYP